MKNFHKHAYSFWLKQLDKVRDEGRGQSNLALLIRKKKSVHAQFLTWKEIIELN